MTMVCLFTMLGVLSIEIDPSEPKIIVFGNLNPHILIEKLQKVGKREELCSYEEVEVEEKVSKKDEKQNTVWWEQEKQPHPCDFNIEKTKDVRTDKKKSSKDSNNNMNYNAYYHRQEMKKEENHHVPDHEVNFMAHSSMMNPYYIVALEHILSVVTLLSLMQLLCPIMQFLHIQLLLYLKPVLNTATLTCPGFRHHS